MEDIGVHRLNASLGPATASGRGLINDGVDHISLLEFFSPLLVGAADALKFLFRYLIVVIVQDGIVLKHVLNCIKEDRNILASLKQLKEETSVAL